MSPSATSHIASQPEDSRFSTKKILIFVVAYNAEKTISHVLDRIPGVLRKPNVEVLIIDDYSRDGTFDAGAEKAADQLGFKLTVLRNTINQGYGGNQKLGYEYAIQKGFDIVALLHGDGQYAPEKLPMLIEPFLNERADAVFGSRMMDKRQALKGGMPLYKWVGNQVLTRFQNFMLGTHLSEFHTGYRIYSVDALKQIPFERNSNDFHFDTDIIIQFVWKGLRIVELPIPTFYGDEVCHVNGMKYAWDIFKTMLRASLHQRNLLYDRKFDVGPVDEAYDIKLGYASSHTMAIGAAKSNASVLDIGRGRGFVAEELAKKAEKVTALYQITTPNISNNRLSMQQWKMDTENLPVNAAEYDQIFMLDVIEHFKDPEKFLENLRQQTAMRQPEIILSTPNIGFILTRLLLLLGQFNYGRQGILDRTHTRLFTFRSLQELLQQTGYEIQETHGIPAPFPKALGKNWFSHALIAVHKMLISLNKPLFSYQIFVRCKARPTVQSLLQETMDWSEVLHEEKSIRFNEGDAQLAPILEFSTPAKVQR